MNHKMNNIKILDCTLRDGGLLNNFQFEDNYIKAHIKRLSQAGIDYIELGYKSSQKYFDENEYGKLKFCQESYIQELIKDLNISSKLAFMIDSGRYDIDSIVEANKSPFSMARVACYLKDLEKVIDDVSTLHTKGYQTMINIMAISKESDDSIKTGLRLIRDKAPFCGVYIVDSYGAFLPQQIAKIAKMYKKILGSIPLGIHAHNNMQLAFANTITAIQYGVELADASVNGMGRGAGNCPIELLMPLVDENKYTIKPVLKLSDMYYSNFRNNLLWGFSNQQMLTGLFNVHPVESLKNRGEEACSIFSELDREKHASM